MKKNIIKILALVLMFALVITLAVSCKKDEVPGDTNTPGNNGSQTPVDDGRIYPDIPEGITFDEGGKPYQYRILTYTGSVDWNVRDMYAEDLNEDPINDSVFKRNKAVEDLLKIEIVEIPAVNAAELAKKSISSRLDEYDLIVVPSTSQVSLAQNGYLYRLDDMEYLDPTKPWWDNNAYESLSIADTHFIIVGDMQIMDKDATWVQFFNKEMIKDYGLEDPFELVLNNEWTIDKQIEMIKKVTKDTSGNGLLGKEDTFGMASTSFSPLGFFYGFGEKITTKNEDDIPELTMNSPRINNVVNYINEVCGKNSTIAYNTPTPAEVQEIFQGGRALFMGEVLQLAERLRDMDTEFGLLPYPKYDKNQDNYYSLVHSVTCMLSVPNTIADSERNSIIMEALCAESRYTLREAYYDTSLTNKFLRYDEGSSKMLDIIFDNRVYDLGYIHNWGGYYESFMGMFVDGSTEFASMYAKNETQAIKAIEDVVEQYEKSAN